MDKSELLKGLLIAFTASALTLGAQHALAAPAEPRVLGAVPGSGASDLALESALARMEALLKHQPLEFSETISRAEAPISQRVAAGPPSVPDEIQEILKQLARIERRLDMRPRIVRELQPLDRLRAPNVEAIRAALDLRDVDHDAFESDLHMRTMQEIVERFGYPSKSMACGGGSGEVYWHYELPSADPENSNYFACIFTGSRVLWTEGRWTE